MLSVVQDGLSRPRLYRPARPRVLYTRPPRSIPHNEPIALRQLQRRHPHQPPRYQSGALLLHELCRRVQPRGCMTDCLTPEEIHRILISMPVRSPSERAETLGELDLAAADPALPAARLRWARFACHSSCSGPAGRCGGGSRCGRAQSIEAPFAAASHPKIEKDEAVDDCQLPAI